MLTVTKRGAWRGEVLDLLTGEGGLERPGEGLTLGVGPGTLAGRGRS